MYIKHLSGMSACMQMCVCVSVCVWERERGGWARENEILLSILSKDSVSEIYVHFS